MVKGGGQENGMNSGGESDMTNKMVIQGVCVGDYGDTSVVIRGGSSTMASYILKKKKKKKDKDGQLFGKSKLKLLSSIFLLPEYPSLMETS